MNLLSTIKHSSSLQLLSSRLFIQITTILQAIILARILGPEGKGLFTEVILWPTMIASFSMMGLYTGIVRFSAKDNHFERFNTTRLVLKCTCMTGLIGAIISFWVNRHFFSNSLLLFIAEFYCIYVVIYNINRGLSAINNGRGRLDIYSIASAILNPVYFLLLLLLYIFNAITIESALASLLFANFLSCLYLYFRRDKTTSHQCYSSTKLFRYSLRFAPSDFSEPLYAYYDKAIIAIFFSPYLLGLYTVSYSSAGLLGFISNSFAIKIFSDVARGNNNDLAMTLKVNILISTFFALIVAAILPIAIPIVFGREFSPAIIPAILLLPVCILQGQSQILERAILAKGYPFVGIKAKCIAMSIFTVSGLILYLMKCTNLNIISLILLIVQSAYISYLQLKFKSIFKIKYPIPRLQDIKQVSYVIFRRLSN